MLFYQDTKLKGRKKRKYLEVVDRHLARVAKALVISRLIVIFHPRNRES